VSGLAFDDRPFDEAVLFDERLGILLGSLLSGAFGYAVLRFVLPKDGAGDA